LLGEFAILSWNNLYLRWIFRIMRIIYLLSLLLTLAFSCSENKSNFSVEVDISDTDGSLLYIAQRTISGTVVVDSALPDKSGAYKLKGYTAQPDFFIVYHQPRQYINLIIHPGDNFKVLTNAASFDVNYLVEGSKDSRLIQKMVNMQARTLEKITEISTKYEKSMGLKNFDKVKVNIDSTYEKIVTEHKKFSIALIKENPGSLAGLMALYQQLGRNTPVFDYKKDFRYYEMVDSNLAALYPNSEAVMDLDHKVTELRTLLKLETGSMAPDIALPDSTGKVIALSSLRNKYVLLLFWASWSSQSVDEVNRFAVLYKKLGRSDVEYYQVSLDRSRESWLACLTNINTRGVHVSDLKYWDSPVVALYRIEKLPLVYFLNKEGVIVNRNFKVDELPILSGMTRP
jgi:hypothetical protein